MKLVAPEPVLKTIRFAAPPATLVAVVAVVADEALVAVAALPEMSIAQVPLAPVPSVFGAPIVL